MLKKLFLAGAAMALGIMLGMKSGISLLKNRIAETSLRIGAWSYNPYVGSEDASGLTRAAIAVIGFLGMTKEESVYFVAKVDDNGDALTGRCTYKIQGTITRKDARWWSITVYDADTDKLIKTNENRYSFNGDSIQSEEEGNISIVVSAKKQEGNWLPVNKDTGFDLTLRMYNPSKIIIENTDYITLPTITREECL